MTCWYIAEMWKAENFISKPLQNVPAVLCPEIMIFFSDLPREDVIEVEGNKILVTHGHYYGVSMAFDQLAEAARSRGCNAAFFGHIHVPVVEKEAGVLLVNPRKSGLSQTTGTPSKLCSNGDRWKGRNARRDPLPLIPAEKTNKLS